MATILISNLAPIGDSASAMFDALFETCLEDGHSYVFWSCIHRKEHSQRYLPMRWDIGLWDDLFSENVLAKYRTEAPLVDSGTWLPRLDRLCKQSVPRGQRQSLFSTLYAASRTILEMVKPNLFLAWNPLCPHTGVMADLCRHQGIPVLLLERGPLSDTWYLESGGLLGHSELAGVPLKYLVQKDKWKHYARLGQDSLDGRRFDTFNHYSQQIGTDRFVKISIGDKSSGPKIAFFPPDDTSLGFTPKDGKDRVKSLPGYISSYEAAVSLARANAAGITLFKPHPSFLEETLPDCHESGLLVVEEDFRRMIKWSDVVATTGSGLQFLALAAGRPIISMGIDLMTGKGISYEALHSNVAVRIVEDAFKRKGFQERIERFHVLLGYLMHHYFMSLGTVSGRHPKDAMHAICRKHLGRTEPSMTFEEFAAVRERIVTQEAMMLT